MVNRQLTTLTPRCGETARQPAALTLVREIDERITIVNLQLTRAVLT
jgi:hypothetical protein